MLLTHCHVQSPDHKLFHTRGRRRPRCISLLRIVSCWTKRSKKKNRELTVTALLGAAAGRGLGVDRGLLILAARVGLGHLLAAVLLIAANNIVLAVIVLVGSLVRRAAARVGLGVGVSSSIRRRAGAGIRLAVLAAGATVGTHSGRVLVIYRDGSASTEGQGVVIR